MNTASGNDDRSQRAALLISIARQAIGQELGRSAGPPPVLDKWLAWLEAPAATFVTLEREGRLRGCIGSLEARKSLRDDIADNARAAAFEDPRFPPLSTDELEGLGVEVSVLSKPEPVECSTQADLLAALRPGVDGLVLECGPHRATFLPQVWENLPEPADFLAALEKKAGLERGFWSEEMQFSLYTVEKYRND